MIAQVLGLALAGFLALAPAAAAQGFSALARAEPATTRLAIEAEDLVLDLGLSQPVPWRVRVLAAPPRVVLDFREVDFSALDLAGLVMRSGGQVTELRAGPFGDGWSRLVLTLDRPRLPELAEMRTDGVAHLHLRLQPADPARFAEEAARPETAGWAPPERAPVVADPPKQRQRGDGALVVVLDPGHGGIDPGAQNGGQSEAALMLLFAQELKDALVRAGIAEVVLTRAADVFVPLETRVAIAHAAQADLFMSLHADALPEGVATGATIYTLAAEASDEASAALAERHDRDALLSGVDLTGQDDLIAAVLMDLARVETAPRADRLADALVAAISVEGLRLHRTPRRGAAFSVLKSPDIPSVLVELGYLSSPRDLERLMDPKWRARMVTALVAGISDWAVRDAAEAGLLRQ